MSEIIYGLPEWVSTISGIVASAAMVITIKKKIPPMLSSLLFT